MKLIVFIFRINYFQQYLHQLDRAIKNGAQIKGYFAWSLLDNFEYVSQVLLVDFSIYFVDRF